MERQYAPYPKWFGTAFKGLECAGKLSPLLWQAQVAPLWPERSAALGAACELLARRHNELGLTPPLPETLSQFHGRPYRVIQAEAFTNALFTAIIDPEMRRIAGKGPLGGIDQVSDNTILRSEPGWRQALMRLYE